MSPEEIEYFRERAAAETALAFAAMSEPAAKAHAELALHYQAIIALAEGGIATKEPQDKAKERWFRNGGANLKGRVRSQ